MADGKLVNMGVIDLSFENKILATKVPKEYGSVCDNARKTRGSLLNTFENMYVIGNF
jgi:hypothetical protein